MSSQVSKDGDFTTSLGSLLNCSVTVTVEYFFLTFHLNFLYSNLCPLTLVLLLGTTENSLAWCSLLPHQVFG